MQPPESPAEVYERHMVPAMLAAWVPALLDLVALKPGEPGPHALTRALERHVGTEAAGLMSAVFRLGDARALQTILEIAGFREVRVRRDRRVARFPSAEVFVRCVVVGSVLGRTGVHPDGRACAHVNTASRAGRRFPARSAVDHCRDCRSERPDGKR